MKYLFIFLNILCIFSCQNNRESVSQETPELIMNYLTEHVASVISVEDDIMLRFKNPIKGDLSKSVSGVSISPGVKGEFKWFDDLTLIFIPENLLDYDQAYELKIDMSRLAPESKEDLAVGPMIVSFRTRRLQLSFSGVDQKMKVDGNVVSVSLKGTLLSNQYIDPENVKSMLEIDEIDDPVHIEWVHTNNNRSHRFEITGIRQGLQPKEIQINVNGGKLASDFKDTFIVTIASSSDFSIEDIFINSSPSSFVRVLFSHPLLANQDLRGLIRVNGEIENIKTLIEGNELRIYPDGNISGDFTISISRLIKSYNDSNLKIEHEQELSIEPVKPQLRLAEKGVLVPADSKITFPFEAVNIDTVDIEIFKIYDQNVLQFMQDNALSGDYNLEQVGKIVYRDKLSIASGASVYNNWQSIAIDLSDYFNLDKDAIYQVRLGFRPTYVNFACNGAIEEYVAPLSDESIMDYKYYDYSGWNDPCAAGYYTPEKFVSRNVIFSNVGAIIKRSSSGAHHVAISRISDGLPLSDAKVEFYDFQKVLLAELRTGSNGLGQTGMEEMPSFAVIRHDEGTTYLNLLDASANSITDFNTGGKKSKDGFDAFLYSDRGVYRPGDTIFINAMLDAGSVNLPDDHPVRLTVRDAQGQVKFVKNTGEHQDHIYSFIVPTEAGDKTGSWNATLQVGGVQFAKRIPVETIKPNRLRLSLHSPSPIRFADEGSRTIGISSSWLHGAPASNLKVKIDVQWLSRSPDFENFSKYTFMDPARQIESRQVTLFEGNLNEKGEQDFQLKLDKNARFPAMLKGNVTSRVFEKGGDFSENYSTLSISPYPTYVGVSMPANEWGYTSVRIGDEATFEAVVLNENGRPAPNRKLSVGVYDIKWQWWYYRGQRLKIYELNSDQHTEAVLKTEANSGPDGMVQISIDTEELEYGRKMIRICDMESGHCTGDFFYASGWNTSASSEERNSLSRLSFVSDKESYKVGEEVTLKIPSEEGTRILISLESEDQVIRQEWIAGIKGGAIYKFETDPSMAPNIYAHASLVQSYDQAGNDLPIRMYGVIPIMVTDPEKELQPKLFLPAQIKPQESFELSVSEESGRSMSYTIAIVDEGLLDLTNYKTPDPHSYFYAKRSLGVKTWDVYDDILYGLNGTVDKIISVGGDGTEEGSKGEKKAIRFKPVVFSEGPFYLEAGASKKHVFTMPNYIGSVRAMVIARKNNAYGQVSAAVPVKSPLMILPTVPRVLSQGEKINIPVSVFAMEQDVKEVKVALEASDNLSTVNSTNQVSFTQPGEQTTSFDVQVGNMPGIAKINVMAESGRHIASQQIEVTIRNPNPVTTDVRTLILQPGEQWSADYNPFGSVGTNEAVLELSQLPSVKLASRIDYLVRYPYGCIEQTISASFAQLYLKELTDYVSESQIDRNINAGIKRVLKMQHPNGGFRYWPSSNGEVHEWGSSYAGHFLIEAKEKGYFVSNDVLRRWADDQNSRATRFRYDQNNELYYRIQSLLNQAYRLYTLSLFGAPNLSAMNLLRTQPDLSPTGKFLLAAAYARSSKTNIALDLINGASTDVLPYRDLGYTYGSEVRDMALIAQTLTVLDRTKLSIEMIKKIADRLNSETWYSTQSIAFGLLAIGKVAEEYKGNKIEAVIDTGLGNRHEVTYDKPIFTMTFNPDEARNKHVEVTNNSKKILFVSFQLSGQKSPAEMLDDVSRQEHVRLIVNYKNLDGTALDVTSLEQGIDFYAEIIIENLNTRSTKIDEMALTHMIPSGWEIRSGRLNEVRGFSQDNYEYQDVRDDRIHTFFDLTKRKKYGVLLHATYAGEYFLPPVTIEAMYDKSINARTKGKKVRVFRSQTQ